MNNNLPIKATPRQHDIKEEHYEIRSGNYWKKKDTGEVRLITSLHIIDNILHSLEVLVHPEHGTNIREFTYDEFLDKFEYIPQDEVLKIRDAEINRVLVEIDKERKELEIGYVDKEGVSANDLLSDFSNKKGNTLNLPLVMAKNNAVADVKRSAENIKDVAQKQSLFIKEKSEIIQSKHNLLGRFHKERASQSIASIDGALQFVKKLNKSIHTLDIYLGKGVEVVPLVSGKGADSNELIHFYQRRLFFDEEWFYNLAEGGADFRDIENFQEALKSDFSIIERMLPAQKSVVLMQYRREEKREKRNFSGYTNFMDVFSRIMTKIEDRESNEKRFLLIRNGENVSIVHSDDLGSGKRLFPISAEMNGLFSDGVETIDGVEVDKKITFTDGRNYEVRSSADDVSMYYKRLLLMINGIHVRDESVFGKLKDDGYDDWMSYAFQKKNFKFIHDDEDALGMKSESLISYTDRHNKEIQEGSRVIGDWDYYMNEDNAPEAFSNKDLGHGTKQIYSPIVTFEPHRVTYSNGVLCCYVECKHKDGYFDKSKKNKLIKVFLGDTSYDYLVIDKMQAKDIVFYLESRTHRAEYARFAKLLIATKKVLDKEELEAKPQVESLTEYVEALYRNKLSPEVISRTLYESIAFWRIKNKGAPLPFLNRRNIKILNEVGEIFHYKTVGSKLEEVEKYIIAQGHTLTSITSGNDGKYYAYCIVPSEEKKLYAQNGIYPFLKKLTIEKGNSGPFISNEEQVPQFIKPISEEVLKVYKKLEDIRKSKRPVHNYLKKVERLKASIATSTKLFNKIINNENIDDILLQMMEDRDAREESNKTGYVLAYTVSFPVGLYFAERADEKDEWFRKNHLVMLEQKASLSALVARYGSQDLRDRDILWLIKYYKHSEKKIEAAGRIAKERANVFSLDEGDIGIHNENITVKRITNGYLTNNGCYSAHEVELRYSEASLETLEGFENRVFSKRENYTYRRMNEV